MHLFSQSLSIVLRCLSQLLNVLQFLERHVYSVARLCSNQSFLSLSCHNDVMLLDSVCCTRLIRTRIIVCSASELPSASARVRHTELRQQLVHWSLKYRAIEHNNLQGASCRPRFVCGMTFLSLCLTPERWMGLMVQSTVICSVSCIFSDFRGAGACGIAKAIYKEVYFFLLGLCCRF